MVTLCIDIGNTHTHFGRVSPSGVDRRGVMTSRSLPDRGNPLGEWMRTSREDGTGLTGVAFCSVIPAMGPVISELAETILPKTEVFQLTHQSELNFRLDYPSPSTIGQDRLANAVATQALIGTPAIILDAGTAVTCDVLTAESGFEGGIIAPGFDALRAYLHEKTAQLPLVNESSPPGAAIGRSTKEAMEIGTTVGFVGMIRAFLDLQTRHLTNRGLQDIRYVATGGSVRLLDRLEGFVFRVEPDLTLLGLHQALLLTR